MAHSSILQPCNDKTQDQIGILSLMSVIYGHASDLQAVLYWIQDAQIIAIGFDWAHGASEGGLLYGSCCHCSGLNMGV